MKEQAKHDTLAILREIYDKGLESLTDTKWK